MNMLMTRSAVSPVRRRFDAPPSLPTVDAVVAAERPDEPLHCLRPDVIAAAARGFVAGFPGSVLYAVKCNPEPRVLRALWAGGIRHFDCASVYGNDIVYHEYYDVGVAVSTDRGLVVPVLRDADALSFGEIEKSIVTYATKARGPSSRP